MGTCRSARLASWEEVAAVSESPRLTLGNPGSSMAFRDLEIVFGYNVYSRKHRINFVCLGFGSKRDNFLMLVTAPSNGRPQTSASRPCRFYARDRPPPREPNAPARAAVASTSSSSRALHRR